MEASPALSESLVALLRGLEELLRGLEEWLYGERFRSPLGGAGDADGDG
jgi:hypothetical protein